MSDKPAIDQTPGQTGHVALPGSKAVEAAMNESYADALMEVAQAEMPQSIKVLAELRDDEDVNASVRRGAANDLIEHGHEKNLPGGLKGAMERAARGGVTVNVLQFNIDGSSKPGEKTVDEIIESASEDDYDG